MTDNLTQREALADRFEEGPNQQRIVFHHRSGPPATLRRTCGCLVEPVAYYEPGIVGQRHVAWQVSPERQWRCPGRDYTREAR
jgi:hypothetical protein